MAHSQEGGNAMGEISIFSEVESVPDSVKKGVNDAVEYWEEEIRKARDNENQLTEAVEKIIVKVKEKFPEVKWRFGLGQDNEGWHLKIFSNAESMDEIFDLARPIQSSHDDLDISVLPLTLAETDEIDS